jgi:hypothetical protein
MRSGRGAGTAGPAAGTSERARRTAGNRPHRDTRVFAGLAENTFSAGSSRWQLVLRRLFISAVHHHDIDGDILDWSQLQTELLPQGIAQQRVFERRRRPLPACRWNISWSVHFLASDFTLQLVDSPSRDPDEEIYNFPVDQLGLEVNQPESQLP